MRFGYAALLFLLAGCDLFEASEIRKGKEAVALAQLDPDSSQFDSVQICQPGIVSGMVNSKNVYGAYGGRTHFVVVKGRVFQPSSEERRMSDYLDAAEVCRFHKLSADALLAKISNRADDEAERAADAAERASNAANAAMRTYLN